ncbi:efflux transporter periplasmic adaptor subunit [Rhodospirillum rubrum]|nr:efflux transporter periplasmic adaptor subunit [Rhodospirillum rubrum]MBK1676108.1 efflux transporter periplasmic adaptor subunit [Rhodospirillum rubrum]
MGGAMGLKDAVDLAKSEAGGEAQRVRPLRALPPPARQARPPRRGWLRAGLGLAILAALVGLFVVYGPFWRAPPVIPLVTVEPGLVVRVVVANGRLRAAKSVTVRPRVAGQLIELAFEEGARVARGAVLARLDPAIPASVVAQAEAALSSRRSELDQAERDLGRASALQRSGAGSVVTRDDARFAVSRLGRDIARLEAAAEEAQARLEETVIRAPFDGIITERPVDGGQVVGTDTALYTLAATSVLDVETEIDEALAVNLAVGQPARMIPAGPEPRAIDGRVLWVSPRVDPATGGRLVRVGFLGEPPAIPVGHSVDITIEVERREGALSLPRASILEARTAPAVLVAVNGVLVRRPIRFIDWPAAEVIVTEGLSAGEAVALAPLGLTAGMVVAPGAAAGD